MTWSWRCYIPLVEHAPNPDVAHLLGARVVVEVLEETHYAVDTAVDLCRVRRLDSPEYEDDTMELRIRAAHHYSAGVECWVARPRLRLTCGPKAGPEDALAEANSWLRKQTSFRSVKRSAPMARSLIIPIAEPVEQLLKLANGTLRPPHVVIRRRRVRTAVPSDEGVVLEQSDLSAGGQVYRSVSCEGVDALAVRRMVGKLKDLFLSRGIAPGVLAAPPLFVQILLRQKAEAASVARLEEERQSIPHTGETCDQPAPSRSPPPTQGAALQARLLGSGLGPLLRPADDSARVRGKLLDAWEHSSDAFALRKYHAAQEHPSTWPPPAEAAVAEATEAAPVTAPAPRLPPMPPHPLLDSFPRLSPAVPLAFAGARTWSHADAGWTAEAKAALADCFAALDGSTEEEEEDEDEELEISPLEIAEWKAAERAAARAAARAADEADRQEAMAPYGPQSGYGLLAQFPAAVVRQAMGESAAAGDTRRLEQLLIGARGAHLDAPCGVRMDVHGQDASRHTALHLAAAAGHAACVQLLLRSRAEPLATSTGGVTALHLAAQGGGTAHAACAQLLLRYGASARMPDLCGRTAIDCAAAAVYQHGPDASACDELLASYVAPPAVRPLASYVAPPAVRPLSQASRTAEDSVVRNGFGGPMRYRLDAAAAVKDEGSSRNAWVGALVVAP